MSRSKSIFTADTLRFLSDLKANNNRDWFAANKDAYEATIKAPAQVFGDALSEALSERSGMPHRSKLFRAHRDVRFSKDKTPYNAHLHMSFAPQVDQPSPPAWMFGLGTEKLSLGVGVFGFEPDSLSRFRDRIVSDEGPRIKSMLSNLSAAGVRISEPELKRVPNGYDKTHPNADLLRHKGMSAWVDLPTHSILTPDLTAFAMAQFETLHPVFEMLIERS